MHTSYMVWEMCIDTYPEKYKSMGLELVHEIKPSRLFAANKYVRSMAWNSPEKYVVAMYDNSFMHKGKSGFIITSDGIITDTQGEMKSMYQNREYADWVKSSYRYLPVITDCVKEINKTGDAKITVSYWNGLSVVIPAEKYCDILYQVLTNLQQDIREYAEKSTEKYMKDLEQNRGSVTKRNVDTIYRYVCGGSRRAMLEYARYLWNSMDAPAGSRKEAELWYEFLKKENVPGAVFDIAARDLDSSLIEDNLQGIFDMECLADDGYQPAVKAIVDASLSSNDFLANLETAEKYVVKMEDFRFRRNYEEKIGEYYFDGHTGKKDLRKAYYWFETAYTEGYKVGPAGYLGLNYEKGITVEPDAEKALMYYREFLDGSFISGEPPYKNALAFMAKAYLEGNLVERDVETGREYLVKAIKAGDFESLMTMRKMMDITVPDLPAEELLAAGKTYIEDSSLESRITGIEYIIAAADKGNDNAAFLAGDYYKGKLKLDIHEEDKDKAIHYYRMAADHGDAKACYEISGIYSDFGDVEHLEKAIEWIDKASGYPRRDRIKWRLLSKLAVEKLVEQGYSRDDGQLYVKAAMEISDEDEKLDLLKSGSMKQQNSEEAALAVGLIYRKKEKYGIAAEYILKAVRNDDKTVQDNAIPYLYDLGKILGCDNPDYAYDCLYYVGKNGSPFYKHMAADALGKIGYELAQDRNDYDTGEKFFIASAHFGNETSQKNLKILKVNREIDLKNEEIRQYNARITEEWMKEHEEDL